MKDITVFDSQETYCPMLGHELEFSYCRTVQQNKPCRRIRDCWFEKISIDDFLAEHYSLEELSYISEPPKPKMLSLFELIQKAQEMKNKES